MFLMDLVAGCNCDEDNEYTSTGADANILAFAQRIREMTPRVNEVYLSITDIDGYVVLSSGKLMRFLLSNLFQLTNTTLLANGYAQLVG